MEETPAKLDTERVESAKIQAKRVYLVLLAIGLAIGTLVAIGVVMLLDRFDLTDVPAQVEEE